MKFPRVRSPEVTHPWQDLLVEGEGDVGAVIVLVTGTGMAFWGRRGRVGAPALSEALTGLHKTVALPDGDAALARGTPATAFGTKVARHRTTPHLGRTE